MKDYLVRVTRPDGSIAHHVTAFKTLREAMFFATEFDKTFRELGYKHEVFNQITRKVYEVQG